MQAVESRYNLISKLWYHGAMQQREAESTLHECAEELKLKSTSTCYLVREHRGTLYLSVKSGAMCYHIVVHRMSNPKGFCLEGHHNIFQSLGELMAHHQNNPVYVDGGDFLLNCCCHKEYVAYALRYINDYKGPCILQVRPDALVVKKSNGVALGSWAYCVIREFKFDDMEKNFLFTSGRRGPFGVENYNFDLHDRIYYNIRETVNYIARGGTPDNSPHRSSVRNPSRLMEGLQHVGGGSLGTGVSRMKEQRHQNRVDHDNECYVPSIARKGSLTPPPVPPHANGHQRRVSHDVSPIVKLISQNRSSSIPDLRENVTRTNSTNSARAAPIHTINFRSSGTSSSSSTGGDTSVCDSDDSLGFETNPHNTGDYQVPRNVDDGRNDYQVPRPIDETYMVPRKAPESGGKKNLEHSYEDPDIMFGDKVNTIKIISRLP